jgi:hypothetical protein
MFVDPLVTQRTIDPALALQVKVWVHEALHVGDDTTVIVTEMHCTTSDCPPGKTVIAIMEMAQPGRQYKIHKPLVSIAHEDIIHLATTPPKSIGSGSSVESQAKEGL